MVPINYVTFTNKSSSLKIRTNSAIVEGSLPNIVLINITGLLEAGENTEDTMDKSYTDGSIFNPNATLSGKKLTAQLVCLDKNEVSRINDFLKADINFTFSTDWLGPYNCQYTSMNVEDGWGKDNYFLITLTFSSKEAF